MPRNLWPPLLLLLISGLFFALLVPYIPSDETRYIGVAWDMRVHHSIFVPLLNGEPYSHKPPFLFWLIQLDWLLLGVNEITLRFLPLLCSMVNLALVYKIAMLLWDDEKTATWSAWILVSTFFYLTWSSLVMFDVLLTTWVLLGILGIVGASRRGGWKPWWLVGVAIGGGILAKGPVLFVHVLPAALLAFFWMPKGTLSRQWYLRMLAAIGMGLCILALWLVPAALTGGDRYREAILWGQTVHRVVSSFAHQHPVWWYVPILPALLLPWLLVPPVWKGSGRIRDDQGRRFVLTWILSTFVAFSLISGKQVHYLIPLLPAFSLWMARNLAMRETSRRWWIAPIALLVIGLGILVLFLPAFKLGKDVGLIQQLDRGFLASGLILLGLLLVFLPQRSMSRLVPTISVTTLVMVWIVLVGGRRIFDRFDVHGISSMIRQKQSEGFEILNLGEYDGQYQFFGRLEQPLTVFPRHILQEVKDHVQAEGNRRKVLLLTYEPLGKELDPDAVLYSHRYRSEQVVLWNEEGTARALAR